MRLKIKKIIKEKKSDIIDHINIPETTGDVLDFKPYNHDNKYASYFPTPGIDEAFGPYEDEDDKIIFFGGEDSEEEEIGSSDDSKPKINYANKIYRSKKIFDLYKKIK